MEETLVLIKPEGVRNKIAGEIISRIERAGLTIVGMKMMQVSKDLAEKHYPITEEWYTNLYNKTKEVMAKKGIEMTETPLELGTKVRGWLVNHVTEGPIIAMVIRGNCAVECIRKLAGHTECRQALPGTIRGDFSTDSYSLADKEKRAIRSIIHASDSVATAKKEIALWFKKT
jgi:nucleoside-diphosphate kinase